MAKKNLTKAQVTKLIVTDENGKVKVPTSVLQILGAVESPHTYVDLLALFDKAGVEIIGDDSNPKTSRVRRMRWAFYRLRKKGFAETVEIEDGPNAIQITKSGRKALETA